MKGSPVGTSSLHWKGLQETHGHEDEVMRGKYTLILKIILQMVAHTAY